MVSIYEQIEEAEKKLNLEPQGDEDGKNDDGSNGESGDGAVRGQGGQHEGERPEQGAVPELRGETGGRGDDEGASRDESGASSGDARAPLEDSGGTQKDEQPSQKDGEDVLEKPLTNADWARQRRELREAKAELARLKAEKPATHAAETKTAEKPPETEKSPEKTVEPDKNVNYQAWLEWKLAQTDNTIQEQRALLSEAKEWRAEQTKERETQVAINNAVGEFQTIEQSYQKSNPDYLNAMEFARNKYAEALKITNPQMTAKQIDAKIDYDILAFASQKSQLGLNPAEELYDMAMERFGYQKAEAKAEEEAPVRKQVEKPNLRTVSNNKRRSASPLTGGGQGGSIPLTKEIAANMNMAEFSALTPDELSQLEAM